MQIFSLFNFFVRFKEYCGGFAAVTWWFRGGFVKVSQRAVLHEVRPYISGHWSHHRLIVN